jgi:phosphatidylglycerophosphate synthase
MNETIPFSRFWAGRDQEDTLVIEALLTNRVAIVIAYLAYKLGVTPNKITVASCCSGILSGTLAFFLSTDNLAVSITVIFVLSQLALLLDCADGQVARCTNSVSVFGAFLDHGLDIFSSMVSFGGFFAYCYRYFEYTDNNYYSNLVLFVGFLFLLSHAVRFLVKEKFDSLLKQETLYENNRDGPIITTAKSLMDYQMSLFAILTFLLSPMLCLGIIFLQSTLKILAYLRYFYRIHRLLAR